MPAPAAALTRVRVSREEVRGCAALRVSFPDLDADLAVLLVADSGIQENIDPVEPLWEPEIVVLPLRDGTSGSYRLYAEGGRLHSDTETVALRSDGALMLVTTGAEESPLAELLATPLPAEEIAEWAPWAVADDGHPITHHALTRLNAIQHWRGWLAKRALPALE